MVIDVYGWRAKEEKCEKERRGKGLVAFVFLVNGSLDLDVFVG